jgi:hypothetical protein
MHKFKKMKKKKSYIRTSEHALVKFAKQKMSFVVRYIL